MKAIGIGTGRDGTVEPRREDASGTVDAPVPAREREILDAAHELLAEGGVEALSMRRLAARVGVSATALYNYFECKSTLMDRLAAEGFRRFAGYLREVAAPHPPGSDERVLALFQAYIRFAREHEAHFQMLFHMDSEQLRKISDLPGEGGYEVMVDAIRDAMDAGRLRTIDPGLVVLYLWAMAHGMLTLSLACRLELPPKGGRPVEPEQLLALVWELVIGGLGTTEGSGPA